MTIDADTLIGKPEWVTHGVLRESLAAWKDLRVCHPEWWQGVNQLGSWDTDLATLAERLPAPCLGRVPRLAAATPAAVAACLDLRALGRGGGL